MLVRIMKNSDQIEGLADLWRKFWWIVHLFLFNPAGSTPESHFLALPSQCNQGLMGWDKDSFIGQEMKEYNNNNNNNDKEIYKTNDAQHSFSLSIDQCSDRPWAEGIPTERALILFFCMTSTAWNIPVARFWVYSFNIYLLDNIFLYVAV